jgi:hypothetical protein
MRACLRCLIFPILLGAWPAVLPLRYAVAAVFPEVKGSNLEGKDFTLPGGFEGERNLVFIAFLREQQADIDTWTPMARRLCAQGPNLRAYELPTIRRGNPLLRWVINQGMASGIHDRRAREATIPLYLDKEMFKESLAIEKEEEITILLLDRRGAISWRTTGTWSEEKERSLKEALRRRANPAG